jgi:mono/diheme cytochrome c family protein
MRAVVAIAVAMMTAALAEAAEPSPASALTPRELAAGRKLYAAKCAGCHKLYEPSRYDAEKWNYWMDKMQRKTRLKDEQYTALSRYLQALRPPQKGQASGVNEK